MTTHKLGRCHEHLRKAVKQLAVNSGEPKQKLGSMVGSTGFGSIHESDFPAGPLKTTFLSIKHKLSTTNEPRCWSISVL
jgi:hypothetical protein